MPFNGNDLKFIQRGTRPGQTFKSDWRPVRALQIPQMGMIPMTVGAQIEIGNGPLSDRNRPMRLAVSAGFRDAFK
jgi:hypothetical protein